MEESKVKETAIKILNLFEDLLEENDITIPDDCREGEESEARLFGATYYELEDAVVDILNKNNDISESVSTDADKPSIKRLKYLYQIGIIDAKELTVQLSKINPVK